MLKDLEKCPKCGSTNIRKWCFGTPDDPRWEVVCKDCGEIIDED